MGNCTYKAPENVVPKGGRAPSPAKSSTSVPHITSPVIVPGPLLPSTLSKLPSSRPVDGSQSSVSPVIVVPAPFIQEKLREQHLDTVEGDDSRNLKKSFTVNIFLEEVDKVTYDVKIFKIVEGKAHLSTILSPGPSTPSSTLEA